MSTYKVLAQPCLWSDQTTVPFNVQTVCANAPAWYHDGSFGNTILVFTFAAPITLPVPSTGVAGPGTFPPMAAGYDRVCYFTTRMTSVGYKGLNWGTQSWINCADSDYGPFALIHELGHSFGLAHPRTVQIGTWDGTTLTLPPLSQTTGGTTADLYDKSTSMGYEATYAQFAAYQKTALGWIVPTTYQGGKQTYTLTSLSNPGGAVYAVRIPCAQFNVNSHRAYWIEYRTDGVGEDGVQIRIENDFNCSVTGHLITPVSLQPGQSMTDGTIIITVQAATQPIPPQPPNTSPDGTTVPPAVSITDAHGDIWSLGTAVQYGYWILRNGVVAANGQGDIISWKGGQIKVHNNIGDWWLWNNGWTKTSAP